ncbi:unnamed protein product [Allacma fusca]|uniref:Uncharacterized protein n=1 Tax=Allacma fusca TaxID=39272 RepID=A0A8J2Q2L7_9HEXA|nr:unnamed protein product [Allacma fusca]
MRNIFLTIFPVSVQTLQIFPHTQEVEKRVGTTIQLHKPNINYSFEFGSERERRPDEGRIAPNFPKEVETFSSLVITNLLPHNCSSNSKRSRARSICLMFICGKLRNLQAIITDADGSSSPVDVLLNIVKDVGGSVEIVDGIT